MQPSTPRAAPVSTGKSEIASYRAWCFGRAFQKRTLLGFHHAQVSTSWRVGCNQARSAADQSVKPLPPARRRPIPRPQVSRGRLQVKPSRPDSVNLGRKRKPDSGSGTVRSKGREGYTAIAVKVDFVVRFED